MRRIHWKWVVVASVLAEASVLAIFFLLLFVANLAGVLSIARPMGTLDYIDAMVSSFAAVSDAVILLERRTAEARVFAFGFDFDVVFAPIHPY